MKGQAAFEFLMSYAWAFIAILITMGALTYFGVLDPAFMNRDSCEIGPSFTCQEYQITPEGKLNLVISNNLGTLEEVNVTIDTDDCTLEDNFYTQSGVSGTSHLNSTLSFSCQNPVSEGSRFEAEITIDYIRWDMSIPQQIKGVFRGHVR